MHNALALSITLQVTLLGLTMGSATLALGKDRWALVFTTMGCIAFMGMLIIGCHHTV